MQGSRLEEHTVQSTCTGLRPVAFYRASNQLYHHHHHQTTLIREADRKSSHRGHLAEDGGNARGSDGSQKHTPDQSGGATVEQARLESQAQRGPGGEDGEAEGNGGRQVDVSLQSQI